MYTTLDTEKHKEATTELESNSLHITMDSIQTLCHTQFDHRSVFFVFVLELSAVLSAHTHAHKSQAVLTDRPIALKIAHLVAPHSPCQMIQNEYFLRR